MSSSLSKFRIEAVKTLAFGAIGVNYAKIGASYAYPISKLYILNSTDAALYFSLDGVLDQIVLPASGFIMLDITMDPNTPDYLPTGDSIYVKRLGAPGSGSVYVSAFYGSNR
jgi:hypothetical protein